MSLSLTIADHIAAARKALDGYDHPDRDETSPHSELVDLIADLIHYGQAEDVDMGAVIDSAWMHVVGERWEEGGGGKPTNHEPI